MVHNTGEMTDQHPHSQTMLILDLEDQHVSVTFEQPSITIGRDSSNRIVVDHPKVSWFHARVELRDKRFILTDQSTNGTYVHPTGEKANKLSREEQCLNGDGIIYLGKASTPDAKVAIHYNVL